MSPFEFLMAESLVQLLAKLTLILATGWLLNGLLRQRHPGWRVLVWRISSLGMILIAMQSFGAPVFSLQLLPAIEMDPGTRHPVATASSPNLSTGKEVSKHHSTALKQSSTEQQSSLKEVHIAGESSLRDTHLGNDATSLTAQLISLPAWDLSTYILYMWSAGIVLGLIRLLVGMAHVKAILKASSEVPKWVELEFAQIMSSCRQTYRVNIRQSKGVTAPCSLGFLHKSILLPSVLCDKNHAGEIRAILAHEVSHFAGHDLQWNIFLHGLSVLLWFHPLAWRVRLAHADACDERCDAMAATCLRDAEGYSRSLARIALESSGRTPTIALPMARTSRIASRIALIRSGAASQLVPRWQTLSASIVSIAILGLLGATGVSRSIAQPVPDRETVADEVKVGTLTNETSKKIQPIPLEIDAPKLIAVWPGDGADKVDPNTELHLRFDQPVDPLSFDLEWSQGGYLECGQTRYLSDKNEWIIPIQLRAGCQHKIAINPHSRTSFGSHEFVTTNGLPVATTEWQFRTAAPQQSADATQPKIVSIDPPLGSKIARVAMIRIRFDQPMVPHAFNLPNRLPSSEGIEFNSGVSYDEKNNEFVFPVALPANWTGQFVLSGLRSQTGIEVGPIKISYSTEDDLFSQEELNRIQRKESLAKLWKVIEKTQQARSALKSISETVPSVTYGGLGMNGSGYSRLEGNWTRFKMQGERQFYGDISQIMGIPFQIGSDGTDCWFFSRRPTNEGEIAPTLITCKFDEIQKKYLSFLNPFSFDAANLEQIVKDRRLEYRGLVNLDGADCHVIRSLQVHEIGRDNSIILMVYQWWIDAKTYYPLQVETSTSHGRTLNRFQIESINQEIPLVEFQPTVTEQAIQQEPEPLGEGYDTKFLKLSDGANGRMSGRWGKTGANGTSSSGLN